MGFRRGFRFTGYTIHGWENRISCALPASTTLSCRLCGLGRKESIMSSTGATADELISPEIRSQLASLERRPATLEERKAMRGAAAGLYEMKVPVLHWLGSKKFLVLDHTVTKLPIEPCDRVVVLATEETLKSLFWKPPKKKRKG